MNKFLTPTLWSFADAMRLASYECDTIAILTGNGLSIGASARFDGDALPRAVLRQHMGEHARTLVFADHPTPPEDVLRTLDHLRSSPVGDFNADREYALLQRAIIHAITENHPSTPDAVGKRFLRDLESFLYQFETVFTTNYDLLQYWAINQQDPPRFQDGFAWQSDPDRPHRQILSFTSRPNKRDSGKQDPSFWHLHGGLHLYCDRLNTIKRKYEPELGSLKQQALADLNIGKMPAVIVEGTRDAKEDKIKSDQYFTTAFEELECLSGAVFTYGWGFNEQDYHIVDALLMNRKIQTIWIGIWKGRSDAHNLKLYARINQRLQCLDSEDSGPMIQFYDIESVRLWTGEPVIVREPGSAV